MLEKLTLPSRWTVNTTETWLPYRVLESIWYVYQFWLTSRVILSTYHGYRDAKSPPCTCTGLLFLAVALFIACGMFEDASSPYVARFCWVVGCARCGDGGCGFSAGFSFSLCEGSGIASGGVIGIVSLFGGAGARLGCSVASTFGVGGVIDGSGIDGAEFTRFAWIAPCGPFTPH